MSKRFFLNPFTRNRSNCSRKAKERYAFIRVCTRVRTINSWAQETRTLIDEKKFLVTGVEAFEKNVFLIRSKACQSFMCTVKPIRRMQTRVRNFLGNQNVSVSFLELRLEKQVGATGCMHTAARSTDTGRWISSVNISHP